MDLLHTSFAIKDVTLQKKIDDKDVILHIPPKSPVRIKQPPIVAPKPTKRQSLLSKNNADNVSETPIPSARQFLIQDSSEEQVVCSAIDKTPVSNKPLLTENIYNKQSVTGSLSVSHDHIVLDTDITNSPRTPPDGTDEPDVVLDSKSIHYDNILDNKPLPVPYAARELIQRHISEKPIISAVSNSTNIENNYNKTIQTDSNRAFEKDSSFRNLNSRKVEVKPRVEILPKKKLYTDTIIHSLSLDVLDKPEQNMDSQQINDVDGDRSPRVMRSSSLRSEKKESIVESLERKRKESIGTSKLKGLQLPATSRRPGSTSSSILNDLPTIIKPVVISQGLLPKPKERKSSYSSLVTKSTLTTKPPVFTKSHSLSSGPLRATYAPLSTLSKPPPNIKSFSLTRNFKSADMDAYSHDNGTNSGGEELTKPVPENRPKLIKTHAVNNEKTNDNVFENLEINRNINGIGSTNGATTNQSNDEVFSDTTNTIKLRSTNEDEFTDTKKTYFEEIDEPPPPLVNFNSFPQDNPKDAFFSDQSNNFTQNDNRQHDQSNNISEPHEEDTFAELQTVESSLESSISDNEPQYKPLFRDTGNGSNNQLNDSVITESSSMQSLDAVESTTASVPANSHALSPRKWEASGSPPNHTPLAISKEDISEGRGSLVSTPDLDLDAPRSPALSEADSGIFSSKLEQKKDHNERLKAIRDDSPTRPKQAIFENKTENFNDSQVAPTIPSESILEPRQITIELESTRLESNKSDDSAISMPSSDKSYSYSTSSVVSSISSRGHDDESLAVFPSPPKSASPKPFSPKPSPKQMETDAYEYKTEFKTSYSPRNKELVDDSKNDINTSSQIKDLRDNKKDPDTSASRYTDLKDKTYVNTHFSPRSRDLNDTDDQIPSQSKKEELQSNSSEHVFTSTTRSPRNKDIDVTVGDTKLSSRLRSRELYSSSSSNKDIDTPTTSISPRSPRIKDLDISMDSQLSISSYKSSPRSGFTDTDSVTPEDVKSTTPATESISSEDNSSSGEEKTMEVELVKGAIGLGFCIEGGKGSLKGDLPISVKRLFKGATSAQGKLQAGDEILLINGEPISHLTHYKAWNHLKALPEGTFKLLIKRK